MSEFYKSIVKYYDNIFIPSNQVEFLANSCEGYKILDIAAATGAVANGLKAMGYDIKAIDLEDEMVEIAKRRDLDAEVMNMMDIDSIKEKFDLVYCIGNSIPHLDNLDQIRDFLKKVRKIIDRGKIVIQWINFEKFLINKSEYLGNLPTIENENVKFTRKYYRSGDKIRFNTILEADGERIENNELLYPLTKGDMIRILEELGYKDIEVFGGFDKSEFNIIKSNPVVIRAKYESI
ncbi:MAG: class I SAM-dependent methyltransferase [Tissierellia bacterium]|nr:class I SAM-dependent methyltransferase [Tissierellia bacterium]